MEKTEGIGGFLAPVGQFNSSKITGERESLRKEDHKYFLLIADAHIATCTTLNPKPSLLHPPLSSLGAAHL